MFYDHRLPGKKDLFSLSAGPGLWYRLSQSIPFHALPSQQVDGIRPRGGARLTRGTMRRLKLRGSTP